MASFPDDHPLNFAAARSTMMRDADVVLVVGSRLNWVFGFGRQFRTDAKIIHIDIEPEEIGANRGVEVGIVGDAKAVLQQLLAELAGHTTGLAAQAAAGPWLAALREQVEKNARRWRHSWSMLARPFAPTGCCARCGTSSHATPSIAWMGSSPWPPGARSCSAIPRPAASTPVPTAAWASVYPLPSVRSWRAPRCQW